MKSVLTDCIICGHTFQMTELSILAENENSFKIEEVGIFASNLGGSMETFSVVVTFVPKEIVDQDVALSWDFTLKYHVNLIK